jgi:hypothetical protein
MLQKLRVDAEICLQQSDLGNQGVRGVRGLFVTIHESHGRLGLLKSGCRKINILRHLGRRLLACRRQGRSGRQGGRRASGKTSQQKQQAGG